MPCARHLRCIWNNMKPVQIVCDFLCLLWSSPMLLPSFSRLVSSWFVSFTSRFEQVLMRCNFHMLLIYKISDGNTTLRCHNLFHFCRRIVSWASLHWSSTFAFHWEQRKVPADPGSLSFWHRRCAKPCDDRENCCIALWCWQVMF